jgi:hypothetical protein
MRIRSSSATRRYCSHLGQRHLAPLCRAEGNAAGYRGFPASLPSPRARSRVACGRGLRDLTAPMPPPRWTGKGRRQLATELTKPGHKISHTIIGALLKQQKFSPEVRARSRKTFARAGPQRLSQRHYGRDRRKWPAAASNTGIFTARGLLRWLPRTKPSRPSNCFPTGLSSHSIGRQLGSRRIRQYLLALVNTRRFSPSLGLAPVLS